MILSEKVTRVMATALHVDAADLKPDARLIRDLGADSLDLLEMVMALEHDFGVDISDDDWEACQTVSDVVELMTRRAKCVTEGGRDEKQAR